MDGRVGPVRDAAAAEDGATGNRAVEPVAKDRAGGDSRAGNAPSGSWRLPGCEAPATLAAAVRIGTTTAAAGAGRSALHAGRIAIGTSGGVTSFSSASIQSPCTTDWRFSVRPAAHATSASVPAARALVAMSDSSALIFRPARG